MHIEPTNATEISAFAHTAPNKADWEPLRTHLLSVAEKEEGSVLQ